jgi:hypothetical protein
MSDEHITRAEIAAYRAETTAFRAETDAFRAESAARIDAYRAESAAQFARLETLTERLIGRFDQVDREIGAIAKQLIKLIEGQNGER